MAALRSGDLRKGSDRRKERRATNDRSSKALARWEELNERQRAYLEAVYRADQGEEEYQRSAFHRGWERRPADE